MKVDINKNENTGLFKAGLCGAGAGYAVKYAWPLADSEKPGRKQILDIVWSKRGKCAQHFSYILHDMSPEYANEFVSAFKRPGYNVIGKPIKYSKRISKIADLRKRISEDNKLSKEIKSMFNHCFEAIKTMSKKEYKLARIGCHFDALKNRPTKYFAGIGASVFVAGAFVKNVINDMTK